MNLQICLCLVAQSCPILSNPLGCSLPGSSVHGLLQAGILEWVAIFLLQGIFPTQGSNPSLLHRQVGSLSAEPSRKPHKSLVPGKDISRHSAEGRVPPTAPPPHTLIVRATETRRKVCVLRRKVLGCKVGPHPRWIGGQAQQMPSPAEGNRSRSRSSRASAGGGAAWDLPQRRAAGSSRGSLWEHHAHWVLKRKNALRF